MDRSYKIFHGEEVTEVGMHDVTWAQVRKQRNAELRDTDWRAVKDRTMSQAWKDFRQALRDLPGNHAEADDAADHWPEAPEDA